MAKSSGRMKEKAVILLSGGLDSAVTLHLARRDGYECHALTFEYGQRDALKENTCAERIAGLAGAEFKLLKLHLGFKGSSLVDPHAAMPLDRSPSEIAAGGIPSTYVPGRNIIFLSVAASFAETIGANTVFIGAHSQDSSGYPDCRREFLTAFDKAIHLGTKAGTAGRLKIEAPLIDKDKAAIIRLGLSMGAPFQFTWSCYKGGEEPCARCDACVLRAKGFKEAGVDDPLLTLAHERR